MSNGIGVAYLPLAAYEDIEVDLYKSLRLSFPTATIHEGIESGCIQFCDNPIREIVWKKEIYDKPTYELDIEYSDDSNQDTFEPTLMKWNKQKWEYEIDVRFKEIKQFIVVLSKYFRIVEMDVGDFETYGIFDLSINLEQYFRNTHFMDYKYSELKNIFQNSNEAYCWFFALNKIHLSSKVEDILSEIGDCKDINYSWLVQPENSILPINEMLVCHWWANLDSLNKFYQCHQKSPFLFPE